MLFILFDLRARAEGKERDCLEFTEGNKKSSWDRRGKAENRSLGTQKNHAKKPVISAGTLSASVMGFKIPHFLP